MRYFHICILFLPDNKHTNFFFKEKETESQRMNLLVSSHATNTNIGLLTSIPVLFSYNWEQWTKNLFVLVAFKKWHYQKLYYLSFVCKVLYLKWPNLIVITLWGRYFHNFIGKVTYSEETKLNEDCFNYSILLSKRKVLQGKGLCWVKNSNSILGNVRYCCINTILNKKFLRKIVYLLKLINILN